MKPLSLPVFFLRLAVLLALPVTLPAGDASTASVATRSEQEFAHANAEGKNPEPPAAVHVFNRPVLVVRAPLMGYSPSIRARGIETRIEKLIEEGTYGPVTVDARSEGRAVMINGHLAFIMQPEDVDPASDMTLDGAVDEAVRFLKTALTEAQYQASPAFLLNAGMKAAGATLLAAVLVWLLLVLHRKLRPQVMRMTKRAGDRLVARGLFFSARLVHGVRGLQQLLLWLLLLVVTAEWITFCLSLFPYTKPWGAALHGRFFEVLEGVFHAVVDALPNLMLIVLILALTRGLQTLLKGFFGGVENGQIRLEWMNAEAARATHRITTVILWLFAVVMIYPYIPGSSSDAFKGMSVFVGLLFSLGSSSVIGQFTSGLMLMYSKALRPGEYVSIGDREGTVLSLGFLSTKLVSPKNEEFHMPNTVILATTIKNYSRLEERGDLLVYTTVTIGYSTPWRQVHALLIEAAKRTPGLLQTPAPFVLQKSLSDFYVVYEINACMEKPERRNWVLAALHENIQDQFNTYGVQIMSPHYRYDTAIPVVVPKARWFETPAAPDSRPGVG